MDYKFLHPECCEYSKSFIVLQGTYDWINVDEGRVINPPRWNIRGGEVDKDTFVRKMSENALGSDFYAIDFCPKCGVRLPEIKLKDVMPEPMREIIDGGYYCNTCKERLHACECYPYEAMWELKENTDTRS